jgi:hypothetical protein
LQADLSNFANATQNDLLSIIDTRDATAAVSARDSSATSELKTLLADAQKALKLQDYYTVYLWNYCSWNGKDEYSFCSPRKAEFWFNPVEVWGLNGTGVESVLPKELKDGLNTYKNVSKYMFIVYTIALVATAVELLIGISAMFSRWGSFVTTFFAAVRRRPSNTLPIPSVLIAILDCFLLYPRRLPHSYDPLCSPQDRVQPCLQSLRHQRRPWSGYVQNYLARSRLLRSSRILLVYQHLLLQRTVALQR